jgi:hypothetical protein
LRLKLKLKLGENSYLVTKLFGEGDKNCCQVKILQQSPNPFGSKRLLVDEKLLGSIHHTPFVGHLLKLPVSMILAGPDESYQFNYPITYHFIVIWPSHFCDPKGTI